MISKKICTQCDTEKSVSDFSIDRRNGNPLSKCILCRRIIVAASKAKNKDAVLAYNKEWKLKNKEKIKEQTKIWNRDNAVKKAEACKNWNDLNPEKVRQKYSRFAAKNKPLIRQKCSKRRAVSKRATPVWANLDDIKQVYIEAAAFGLVVDHIVPLNSKIVCGLHVWHNLTAITSEENSRKGNRYWPDMPFTDGGNAASNVLDLFSEGVGR